MVIPSRNGIPVRWLAIILVIVLWNVLFLLDGFVPWNPPKAPGPFVLLALALLFAMALAAQRSAVVQSWVLKPGRSVGEIRSLLVLLQVISGIMLAAFTFLFLG